MVKLMNITKEADTVTCVYLPDGVNEQGLLKISATDYKILDVQMSPYQCSNPSFYVGLARKALVKALQSPNPLPSEIVTAIY